MGNCKSAAGSVSEDTQIDGDQLHLQSIWAAQVIGSLADRHNRYESKIAALEETVASLRSDRQDLDEELAEVRKLVVTADQPAPVVAEGVILVEVSTSASPPARQPAPAALRAHQQHTIAVGRPLQDSDIAERARVLEEEELFQRTRFAW